MSRPFQFALGAVVGAAVALIPPVAYSAVGVETNLGYSDNIRRVESGGRSERFLAAAVGGEAGRPIGELQRNVRWEVGAIDYLDGAFDTDSVGSLDGIADFALVPNRLRWQLQDQLGLQSLDPFVPPTPASREYVNFFSTGPSLVAPLADSVAFVSSLTFTDVWYEEQGLDNTRNNAYVGFRFGHGPNRSFSVLSSVQEIQFEDTTLYQDYDTRQVYVQYETQRARGTLTATVGTSEIEDGASTEDGYVLAIDWLRTISDYSSLNVLTQHGFSDAGSLFQQGQSIGGGAGSLDYIASVGNPLMRSYFSARFAVTKPRTLISVTYSWTREDYVNLDNQLDRDLPMITAQFSRNVARRLRFEFEGLYTQQNSLNVDQKDQERRFTAGVAWRLGRRAELSMQLARFERASSIEGASYEENRAFLSFGYGSRLSGIQMNQ